MSIMYIIHIREHDGRIWHYIGLTDRENIDERLAEHKRGKGNLRVYEAVKRAAYIESSILLPNGDRYVEKFTQLASEDLLRDTICSHCREQGLSRKK
jgi:hypothetical protein